MKGGCRVAYCQEFLDAAIESVEHSRAMTDPELAQLATFTRFAENACRVNLPQPASTGDALAQTNDALA